MLRKDYGAVDSDVEDPVTALAEFRFHPQCCVYLGCQTGSPRQIVSLNAISDGDAHISVLPITDVAFAVRFVASTRFVRRICAIHATVLFRLVSYPATPVMLPCLSRTLDQCYGAYQQGHCSEQ